MFLYVSRVSTDCGVGCVLQLAIAVWEPVVHDLRDIGRSHGRAAIVVTGLFLAICGFLVHDLSCCKVRHALCTLPGGVCPCPVMLSQRSFCEYVLLWAMRAFD
jgi:hypothetical protein